MENLNKITSIKVYQVELTMKEGHYSQSNQSFRFFDSTIIEIETSNGINGYGEVCPLGPSYLPAYAEGPRAGFEKLQEFYLAEIPQTSMKLIS